jgi:hypothetical protein
MMRWSSMFFPCYFFSGARITYISPDLHEVKVAVPLTWLTRNYHGTIYGGSMFAGTDPIYMIMLIKLLGPNYQVWDKAASIQFKKPGRTTLYSTFKITDDQLNEIKEGLNKDTKIDRTFSIDLVDNKGSVHAIIERTVNIQRRQHHDL